MKLSSTKKARRVNSQFVEQRSTDIARATTQISHNMTNVDYSVIYKSKENELISTIYAGKKN